MPDAAPASAAGTTAPVNAPTNVRATPVTAQSPGAPPTPRGTPVSAPGMTTSDPDDSLASSLEKGMKKMQAQPPAPGKTPSKSPLKSPNAPATPPAAPVPNDDEPPSTPPSNLLESLQRSAAEPLRLEPLPKDDEIPAGTPEPVAATYSLEDANREAEELLKHPHVSSKTKRAIERFKAEAKEATQRAEAAAKATPTGPITRDALPEELKTQLAERDAMLWERRAEDLPEVRDFTTRISAQETKIMDIVSKYFNPATVKMIQDAGGFEKFVDSNPGNDITEGVYDQMKRTVPPGEMRKIEMRRQEKLRLEDEKNVFITNGKAKASELLKAENAKATGASAEDKAVIDGFLTDLKTKEPMFKEQKLPDNPSDAQREEHRLATTAQTQLMAFATAILNDNTPKGKVNALAVALNGLRAHGEREVMRHHMEFYKAKYLALKGATPGNPSRQTPRGEAPPDKEEAKFKPNMTPLEGLQASVAKLTNQR